MISDCQLKKLISETITINELINSKDQMTTKPIFFNFLALLLVLNLVVMCSAQNSTIIASNVFPEIDFSNATGIYNDGVSSRLYVLAQTGEIFIIENNIKSLYMSISDRIKLDRQGGLLGLAFDPNFQNNHFLYVYYTADPAKIVVSRFTGNDTSSEFILLQESMPTLFSNNGGGLVFGLDNYLYIGIGDGDESDSGSALNSQNLAILKGKILRIDVSSTGNYTIPSDNPFINNSNGIKEEIYSYGVRNPFRFSFDSINGSLWLADPGSNIYEEINIIHPGKNYGWPYMEGPFCAPLYSSCNMTGLELPVYYYSHYQFGAIIGGFIYRGSNIPELQGNYIYGDFITKNIYFLNTTTNESKVLITNTPEKILSIGSDNNDELYFSLYSLNNIYMITINKTISQVTSSSIDTSTSFETSMSTSLDSNSITVSTANSSTLNLETYYVFSSYFLAVLYRRHKKAIIK